LVLSAELLLTAVSFAMAAVAVGFTVASANHLETLLQILPMALGFRLTALLWTGLHRRSLRYASVLDLLALTESVVAGSLPFAVVALWLLRASHLSVSFFIVDAAFLQVLWCGLHFGARTLQIERAASRGRNGRRTLIVGAGDAGITLLREMAMENATPFRPVAILDDDASKWGRTICGLPVRGSTNDLAAVAADVRAEEVLICIPSATRAQMHAILDACRRAALPVRTLPPLAELIRNCMGADKWTATVSQRDLRPPRIEDLLHRELIHVDPEETRRLIEGEVVLITGAGGSIGSELARQVAAAGPRRLLLLDKSENGLFYANLEASDKLGAEKVKPLFADLTDRELIRAIIRSERPSIIFHAAAHKHVAMMEMYPREAIRNNVFGTRNIAQAAAEYGVARFVNISTDKAVNPRNWMGLSKKLTELCVQELSAADGGTRCITGAATATRFSSVRFGNVAGSTGSVLRLFWERIERGEPVRVTDPRATRFFMSVPEAVHLILRAAALGRGGETFVLDMGEPVNICDLAKTMILYSGRQPGRDLRIEFTGLQPGEKIDEELWEDRESPEPAGSEHIHAIRGRNPLAHGILSKIDRVEALLSHGAEAEALNYLCAIFPDFRWNRTKFSSQASDPMQRAAARSAGAA
jgi:FlaA1/EpsC-like NDP-sugar epimerase